MSKVSDFLLLLNQVSLSVLLSALAVAEIILLRRTKWIGSWRAVYLPLINLILSIPLAYVLIVVSLLLQISILVLIGIVSGVSVNVNYAPWIYISVPAHVFLTFAVCFCGFFLLRKLTGLLRGKPSSLPWKYDVVFAVIAGTITLSWWLVPVLLRLAQGEVPFH